MAPGSALGEVKNICSDVEDLAAVTLGKSHILFEVGDTELICRRLEGEVSPDYFTILIVKEEGE